MSSTNILTGGWYSAGIKGTVSTDYRIVVDELSTDYSNLHFHIDPEPLRAPASRLQTILLRCTLTARVRRKPLVALFAESVGEAYTAPILLIRGEGCIEKAPLSIEVARWWSSQERFRRELGEYTVLSEMIWSNIHHILDALRGETPKPPHMYSSEDGGFVIDWATDVGRAACVLRDQYAHVMAARDDEIVDRVFEGDDFSIDDVIIFLKKVAPKAK